MKTVVLKHLLHKGVQNIRLDFPYDREWNDIVKRIPAQWSLSHRCWYVENTQENLRKILDTFRGKAWIDKTELKARQSLHPKTVLQKTRQAQKNAERLSEETKEKIGEFGKYMESMRYSRRTVDNYTDMVSSFLGFCAPLTIEEISNGEVEKFNREHIIKNEYSVSYQRQLVSALKLLYARIPGLMRRMNLDELERPKRSLRLPVVLSEGEIMAILKCTSNLKHKSILACIYSSGLRISELLNLQIRDIDVQRMQIRVVRGKGDKDRVVGLSRMLLLLLERYVVEYKPDDYIFNGEDGGRYSATSVRNILRAACRKAGIKKKVTPHVLRHSYATHMLENGVDIRYIQELLGHKKPETTMIYTHVAQKRLENIKSPLDVIAEKASTTDQTVERKHLPSVPDKEQFPRRLSGKDDR